MVDKHACMHLAHTSKLMCAVPRAFNGDSKVRTSAYLSFSTSAWMSIRSWGLVRPRASSAASLAAPLSSHLCSNRGHQQSAAKASAHLPPMHHHADRVMLTVALHLHLCLGIELANLHM